MTFFQFAWLFFLYSLLGWLFEVSFVVLRQHRYQDRGVLGGPFCLIYGITGCIITVDRKSVV